MKSKLTFLVGAVAIMLVAALVAFAAPGRAEAASSFQVPCFPYGTPDYAYGQYIGGWGYHVGDDICHNVGVPVFAAADGTVRYSARTPDSYRWGNLIIIQHSWNGRTVLSLYGHLNNDRRVRAGQTVKKGQRIGTVAPRGAANGNWDPHTHFGIRETTYKAATGSYDHTIHGYEPSCCAGWVAAVRYSNDRRSNYDYVGADISGNRSMANHGESVLRFKLWNTGRQTWLKNGPPPVRLGTDRPRDRGSGFSAGGTADGWSGNNRIKLLEDTPSGELGTFQATFKSNGHEGTYPECFSPVVEGIGWMRYLGLCATMTIQPPGYNYSFVGKSATPSTITPDVTSQDVSVQLKNTGSEPWPVGGALRLETDRARDHHSAFYTSGGSDPWLGTTRPSDIDSNVTSPGKGTVDPGETAEFDFTITIPSNLAAGNYKLYVRPVMDGIKWLPEDYGINFPVPVAPQRNLQFVKTVYSASQTNFPHGSTMYAQVAIRNTGRMTWAATGPTPVRMATTGPQDRSSAFQTTTGPDPWLSVNRASNIDGTVTDVNSMTINAGDKTIEPGQIGLFTVYLTANPPHGTYHERFGLVQDGVGWFPDPGYSMYLVIP